MLPDLDVERRRVQARQRLQKRSEEVLCNKRKTCERETEGQAGLAASDHDHFIEALVVSCCCFDIVCSAALRKINSIW